MIQCILEWSYEHSTYFSFLYKLPDVTSLSWNQSWMRTHSLSTRWWIQAKSQQCCNPLTICELWAGSSGSAVKNSIHSLAHLPPWRSRSEEGEISGLKTSSSSPPQKEHRDTESEKGVFSFSRCLAHSIRINNIYGVLTRIKSIRSFRASQFIFTYFRKLQGGFEQLVQYLTEKRESQGLNLERRCDHYNRLLPSTCTISLIPRCWIARCPAPVAPLPGISAHTLSSVFPAPLPSLLGAAHHSVRLATGQIPFQLVVQRAHGVSYKHTPSPSCFVLVKTNCSGSSCLERKLFTSYLFLSPSPQTLILKNWWCRDCILKKSNLDRESSGPRSRIPVSVPDLLLAAKLLCLPVSFSPSALRMKGLSKGQDAQEREDAPRNPWISARGRKNPPDEVKQNKARKAFS